MPAHLRFSLVALALATAPLVTAPAAADPVPNSYVPRCGNGYCDAWAGETRASCPADCARKVDQPLPAAPLAVPSPVAAPLVWQGPVAREWEPGDDAPAHFHVEKRRSAKLLTAGAVTLGTGYLVSLSIGIANASQGGGLSAIPLVGGFVSAARGASCGDFDCNSLYAVAQVFFGGAQIAGAAMLLAAGLSKSDKLVLDRPTFSLVPVPVVGKNGSGMGFAGAF